MTPVLLAEHFADLRNRSGCTGDSSSMDELFSAFGEPK